MQRRKLVVLALGAVGLAGALTAAALVAPSREVEAAKPYVPRDPATVVAHVPPRGPAEVREQVAEAGAPASVELAVGLAEADVERGLALEDPKYLRHASEVLAAWWELAAPPPAVLMLRARVEIGLHQYADARRDLDALVVLRPEHTQAQLARAWLAAGSGDLDAARKSCAEVGKAAPAIVAATCSAPLDGLADPVHAAMRLQAALDASGDGDAGLRAWAQATLGALAVQQGEWGTAAAEYEAALQLAPDDHAIRAGLADVQLVAGKPRDASALLAGYEAIDSLLVRRAIAEHAVRGPDDAKLVQTVHDRVATAIARGDHAQLAVMARFALVVDGDPAAALTLARAAWAERQELVTARALAAAGDAAAVRAWQQANGVVDAQLERAP